MAVRLRWRLTLKVLNMTSVTLYRAVMGEAFDRLVKPVRQFHSLAGRHELHGWVDVRAPGSWAARLLAICLGAPTRAARGPIRFELWAQPDAETWTRFFPNRTMRSVLKKDGIRVTEKLGASRLAFELVEVAGALEMRLQALHFWGVPCPRWLMPDITARETGEAEQLNFHVQASVPVIGLVVSYSGYLAVPVNQGEAR
jgi:hypothetical protein